LFFIRTKKYFTRKKSPLGLSPAFPNKIKQVGCSSSSKANVLALEILLELVGPTAQLLLPFLVEALKVGQVLACFLYIRDYEK
jgi:hypothetical protein